MKTCKDIKLILLDCDGVLSDGKIIYNNQRVESKQFSAKDGLGIKLAQTAGIEVAIITGRSSEILQQRCDDLGITHLYQNIKNKVKKAQMLLDQLHLDWHQVAYMGDDWNDIPVMRKVAWAAVPSNVFPRIQEEADFIATRRGGDGAVRELIEFILQEQGRFSEVIDAFLARLATR